MGATAAAAAVIAVLATPAVLRPWLEYDTELVSLAGSVGEHRSVLGRLAGGFPHAPLRGPSAGGQDGQATGTDRVLLTSGRIRESFGELQTASQLHAKGVASLLTRQYDDAARLLLAASREQPANARYLNDLSTAQLERARLGLRPDDLPRALAAAERATRLDPSLREAWFNRALAISALSLTDQAKAAWSDYLRRDNASPWAGEARQQLEELMKPTAAEAWEAIQSRLDQSIDAASAEAAVRGQASEARQYLENELFVDWANAVLDGETGAAELDRARVMADAMLRVTGDALYRDAIAAIDAASGSAGSALAQAHKEYAAAAMILDADQFADAAPHLASALQKLLASNSPFAERASIDLAVAEYYANNYARVLTRAQAVKASADARGYAYIRGRAAWILGMTALAQSRLADAQANYEDALATFERMGDIEQGVGAHNLLTALHFYLGNKQEEWRHRQHAFEGLTVSRSERLRFRTYLVAAASLRFEDPDTAILIHDYALQSLGAGRGGAAIQVLASRAHALIALGRLSEAASAIRVAREHLNGITGPVRTLMELRILSPEGELQRLHDAVTAAATAERAIELIDNRNNPADRSLLAQFYLQLAKANIAGGRLRGAEQALAAGIRTFEEERATIGDEGQISRLDENWELFETGIELAIRKGEYDRAFALSERARARTLAEARRAAEPRSLASVRAALDANAAVIALNQFEKELAVWVIRRNGVTVTMRPLGRADAARLVGRQQEEIWRQVTTVSAGRELYNELIRPVLSQLRGATRLVFVPDATYETAAFAAMWDTARRRFLIEDVIVSVSPSAESFVQAAAASVAARTRGPLIIGGPGETATAETNAVAALYETPTVLTGASATTSRFLSDAPNHGVVHVVATAAPNQRHPLLSRLVLTDEPGRRHTGAILGRDIAARAMTSTRLVVLDEPGTATFQRGEGTLTLARAFVAAGVPAVLGTLPGADDDATRDLMIDFHRELRANVTAGEALSRVQRNALQQNGRRLGAWTALVIYGSDR
jgi:CHAT domain-containing protein